MLGRGSSLLGPWGGKTDFVYSQWSALRGGPVGANGKVVLVVLSVFWQGCIRVFNWGGGHRKVVAVMWW